MNVLSLFDGMSCGRIALNRLGINVDNYFSSEINKNAIKIANKNHPQDEPNRLGNVIHIDSTNLPPVDLLIGGSPCFVAGTKVITKNAYKNIEDVQVGDEVLTHKNRFRKVLKIGGDKNKELFEVKAQGMKPTKVTGNHPYYVREMTRKWDNPNRTSIRVFSEPLWKNVSDLSKGDFIVLPILNTSENPRNLTEEDCWLIGRYIADGHMFRRKRKNRKNSFHYGIVYSVGYTKDTIFESNVTRKYTKLNHSKSVYRFTFSSMDMVDLYTELGLGKGAINKTIPMEILNLPKPLLKKILDGYMSGDGFKTTNNDVYGATSISEDLIMTLNLAVAKVYNTSSTYCHSIRPKTYVIEGRTVNQNDTYVIKFKKETQKQNQSHIDGDFVWLPIKSLSKLDTKSDVYNMEVDEDNSYSANNIVVHNCQSFSFGGKKKGMTTKDNIEILKLEQYLELKSEGFEFEGQSYLFWEFIRLLRETNPRYFLLENVKMPKKWEKVINDELGIEPIMIDSNLISAQNRKRLYWTNIPNITQPEDKKIFIKDILDEEPLALFSDVRIENSKVKTKNYIKWDMSGKGYYSQQDRAYFKDGKMCCVPKSQVKSKVNVIESDGVYRRLSPIEVERLQTVDDNYTEGVADTHRYEMLGNGWTVDVIKHIFKNMEIEPSL